MMDKRTYNMEILIQVYVTFCIIRGTQPGHNQTLTPGNATQMEIATFRMPPRAPRVTPKASGRTTPARISFAEDCDTLANYCLRAYVTGKLCGRTLYYEYYTFKNYCLMDYVNCMERYQVWQLAHMGECFQVTELNEYLRYPYDDDYFLDQYYVLEDH